MNGIVRWCTSASPLGAVRIAARGDAIAGIWFEGQKYDAKPDDGWRETPGDPLLRAAARELREYFAGRRSTFGLPLAPQGTAFQKRVWRAISEVPPGRTASYRDLARRIGRPTAVRAVGAAVGRNPLSVVVPCHRIVGADGTLTGYAGGVERKRALLALEGVAVDPGRDAVAAVP